MNKEKKMENELLHKCSKTIQEYWNIHSSETSIFKREPRKQLSGKGNEYSGWPDEMVKRVIDMNNQFTDDRLAQFQVYELDTQGNQLTESPTESGQRRLNHVQSKENITSFSFDNKTGYFVDDSDKSQCINYVLNRLSLQPKNKETIIMMKGDTFETLRYYCVQHKIDTLDFAIVNFANSLVAGGGFLDGMTAQEEILCLRSTFIKSLTKAHAFMIDNMEHRNCPIENYEKHIHMNRAVFTPYIYVYGMCKGNQVHLNQSQSIKCLTSGISVASIDLRPERMWSQVNESNRHTFLGVSTFVPKFWLQWVQLLWDTTFLTAIKSNKKHIIIGPIGCGAFIPNDNNFKYAAQYREIMARILADKLIQYRPFFDTIIYNDFRNENWGIFKKVIESIVKNVTINNHTEDQNQNAYFALKQ
jgi:hypothetical protein